MALDSKPIPYEPPNVEARDSIVGALTAPFASAQVSAVFRSMGYEPPKIEQRKPIE